VKYEALFDHIGNAFFLENEHLQCVSLSSLNYIHFNCYQLKSPVSEFLHLDGTLYLAPPATLVNRFVY
jgi:hypothetical protein